MLVFRIERQRHLDAVLSGQGAALSSSNRWNSKGTAMVYTAESRALALLELAVLLDIHEDLPNDRVLVTIEIPDDCTIATIDIQTLPPEWDTKPPGAASQRIGDRFIALAEHPILRVPSSIVPLEHNYLIHPNHPQSKTIRVVDVSSLHIDGRLRG